MKVLSVASECAPLVKTGGLADVVGALPGALAPVGVKMRVLLPAYRGLAARLAKPTPVAVRLTSGRSAKLLAGRIAGLDVLLLQSPEHFDRDGTPYLDPDGQDWPDNHLRYGYLCEVAAAAASQGVGGWTPDVIHAHDWQAGLVPAYLRRDGMAGPPVLLTIHNIAHQGLFPARVLTELGLPKGMMTLDGLEFWDQVGFLKGGLAMADRLSTVSPSYARELMTPEFGMGLEGLLRHRAQDLSGILNGVDTGAWDPSNDPDLPAPYAPGALGGKAKSRSALAEHFGLSPTAHAPVLIVVSRMSAQKGLDLILDALPAILNTGACLAVLGNGDPALEDRFRAAATRNPGRVGAVIGFDEKLSHLMQGGADAILIPSRFEPCGLTQLYGLRYGTLPIVARTGGLADTVIDANAAALSAGVATGFVHAPTSAEAIAGAVARAANLFQQPAQWATMVANAMRQPVGWDSSAAAYAALYAETAAA